MIIPYVKGRYVHPFYNQPKQTVIIFTDRWVEFLIQLKLDYGIPHGYEPVDQVERRRRVDLEFNSNDWMIYQLLRHYKGRVKFGDDYQSKRQLKDFFIDIGSVRNLGIRFDVLNLRHAEMLSKMARRERSGMRAVPVVPAWAKKRHRQLIAGLKYMSQAA